MPAMHRAPTVRSGCRLSACGAAARKSKKQQLI